MDYSSFVNKNAAQLQPSAIRKFFDIVREMPDAISLGVGEPDFNTPFYAAQAAVRSINAGRTQYTGNAGLPALREAICKYLDIRFGVKYEPEQVLVTIGASEGIDLALRGLVNPGDEVLIPEPSYVSYAPCVKMAYGVPKSVPCMAENQFRITARDLENACDERTKYLILPYPNNPTGAVLERSDLEELAVVIKKKNLFVISDEIYAELTYGARHVSITSIEGMQERTILLNGFSKAFAMTGWRLGYLCAPKELFPMFLKIHQYTIMCAPTASQYAGLEAIEHGIEDGFQSVERMRDEYDLRRRYLVAELNDMGLECFEPKGAFYAFPSVAATGLDGTRFAERLLRAKKVAVVPGVGFGEVGRQHIRISYAYSMKQLRAALSRIRQYVAELREI